MGKNNRQRRQEKQRRHERRRAERAQAPGRAGGDRSGPSDRPPPSGPGRRGTGPSGPGGVRYRADEMPTAFLVNGAALALAEGDEERATGLLAQLPARADARRLTAQAVSSAVARLVEASWDMRLVANVVRRRLTARHTRIVTDGLDGADDVRPAVEVLGVLLRLPSLPPLPATTQVDEGQAKVLAKVRGLLAKAESTTFPQEAEALSAKAQELMARHAIDHALASAGARPEEPSGRRIPLQDPYADAKSLLLGAVARANRCQSIHVVQLAHATVLGFESDLMAVEVLFTSLLVQASRAMLAAGRDDPRSRQRGFRSSFLSAYATRIGQRLEDSTADQVADVDAGEGGRLLPVLAARRDAVEDAVDAMFGDGLVSRHTRISDPRGWVAGHAAADVADLAVGPEVRAAG